MLVGSSLISSARIIRGLFLLLLVATGITFIDVDQRKNYAWLLNLTNNYPISSYNTNSTQKLILYPQYFPSSSESELSDYYTNVLNLTLPQNTTDYKIIKYQVGQTFAHEQSITSLKNINFTSQQTTLYHSNSADAKPKCDTISDSISFNVSEPKTNSLDFYKIANQVLTSEHFQEYKRHFGNIEKHIQQKTVDQHWFRFGGNSVYLQDYGVHFMVSRVSYSIDGAKNKALFSIVYAQIFDESWQEIPNIELIVPTNNETFTSIKYPSILPIATYNAGSLYKGPEDPRIVLTKSQSGYMEPMIIFNAYGQVLKPSTDADSQPEYSTKRYMFLSWPWQTQQGKLIPSETEDSKKLVYSKTVALRRDGRLVMEKNWTPMFSSTDREQYGYDKYMYIVYQWSNLEILKCPLTEGYFKCKTIFQQGKGSQAIGNFRGGTPMVNINTLLESHQQQFPKLINQIPPGKEIWIGFARAHLKNCGCGESMYRPNIVMMIKENDEFKITHVSSYLSLNVPIVAWDSTRAYSLCIGRNVMLPNGISHWVINQDDSGDFEDYLTLTISRADVTVDVMHIQGLLFQMLEKSNNLFGESNDNVDNRNINIINCALGSSLEFCKAFAEERKQIESSLEIKLRIKHKIAYWFLAFLFALTFIQLLPYNKIGILSRFRFAYDSRTYLKHQVVKNQVIFPRSLSIANDDINTFVDNNPQFFNKQLLNYPKFIQAVEVNESTSQKHSHYSPYNFTIFNSLKDINLDLKQCDAQLKSTTIVGIDKATNLQVSLTDILNQVYQEMEAGENPYYNELAPFVLPELRLQLQLGIVDRFWYRLAGSSAWLEQYGVHFMISRILYSPSGGRNQPIISMTYAQLFDENWKELINTKLLVPTNNLKSDKKDQKFKILNFPCFLPIPFWHDYDNLTGKYYGPEDPRLIVVKNKNGYEEPLIIFNAYLRKLVDFDDDDDVHLLKKTDFYRSMFICWPWQFQRGKENVEGTTNPMYDTNLYNRIAELKIKNLQQVKIQKNWTPLISYEDQLSNGFDTHIQFIYRWSNLDVLKCDLTGDNIGECTFTYRLSDVLATKNQVGPLRGGTQLVNVNNMLASGGFPINKFIVPNREIWVGFARAHLDDCGCGKVMYRPNMVVIVKDKVKVGTTESSLFGQNSRPKAIYRDLYKVSHISSSLSLDMDVIGWDLLNPTDLCLNANILIPNGISSWKVNSLKEEKDKWKAEDYLTLSLSISDFTVHKINIHGLLQTLLDLPDKSLFLNPSDSKLETKKRIPKELKKKLLIPDITEDIEDYGTLPGFNNDNIVCALQDSVQFCESYGQQHLARKQANTKMYQGISWNNDDEDEEDDASSEVYDVQKARYLRIINRHQKEIQFGKHKLRKSLNPEQY
ncbi:Beta-mannosyltransferase 8 [Spathaspora sp. JA1]|nr:Beta-mannosyltransferase 8 [Spathaspora sp. JA1]